MAGSPPRPPAARCCPRARACRHANIPSPIDLIQFSHSLVHIQHGSMPIFPGRAKAPSCDPSISNHSGDRVRDHDGVAGERMHERERREQTKRPAHSRDAREQHMHFNLTRALECAFCRFCQSHVSVLPEARAS
jgi:hypothetical protein